MNKLLIVLIVTLFLFSCGEQVEERISPSTRLNVQKVENLSERGIFDAWGITKVGNKFIIRTSNGVTAVPGKETALSRSKGSEAKGVCLFDFTRKKIVEYTPMNGDEIRSIPLELPEGEQHLAAVKGSDFTISTGIYDKGRYLYTPIAGEAKYFVAYPVHSGYPDMTGKQKAILYASSVLRIRPDERSFVCADMYSGGIDFCSVDNGSITLVKRVCFHTPDIQVRGKENPKIVYTKNNRMGFSDITVSEDRVYALYSGKTYNQSGKDFYTCNELLVFDWDGNLLNTYMLDKSAVGVSYDEGENVLYAVSNVPDIPMFRIHLPE